MNAVAHCLGLMLAKAGLRGEHLIGDVAGRTVIVFDDLISTGQTLLRAEQLQDT